MEEPFLGHVASLAGQFDSQSITIHGVYYTYTFDRSSQYFATLGSTSSLHPRIPPASDRTRKPAA
jgi:hypothetical protein